MDAGRRSPIALFAYNRPRHLSACIESLRKNAEAAQTVLYCFLDGPRTEEEVPQVRQVAEVAHSIEGFRDVRIARRSFNRGLSGSIIEGVSQVLAENESVIVVEDDLVVSGGFLRYMNQAIELYRAFPPVFSISAYNYPARLFRLPADYPYDAFFVPRHMCWGWGTWRGRWEQAQWRIPDYDLLKRDESWKRSFRECGVDLPAMLDAQTRGVVDSWAIRWAYTHFIHHAVCLVPVRSLVNNTGTDGSGSHARVSPRYLHATLSTGDPMRFPPAVYVDPQIGRKYKTAERKGFVLRAARKYLPATWISKEKNMRIIRSALGIAAILLVAVLAVACSVGNSVPGDQTTANVTANEPQ